MVGSRPTPDRKANGDRRGETRTKFSNPRVAYEMDNTEYNHAEKRRINDEITGLLREMHGDIKALRVQGDYQKKHIDDLADRMTKNEIRADHVIDDHTDRLTKIERGQSRMTGIMVGVGSVAGAVSGFFLNILNVN